jgi:hypothetical protein
VSYKHTLSIKYENVIKNLEEKYPDEIRRKYWEMKALFFRYGKGRHFNNIPERDLDLYETVLRYKLRNNVSEFRRNATAYVVEIEGRSPNKAFLSRFKDIRVPIIPMKEDGQDAPPVEDKELFKRRIILGIHLLRHLDENRVEVVAWSYTGFLDAGGAIYEFELVSNRWVYRKKRLEWIS